MNYVSNYDAFRFAVIPGAAEEMRRKDTNPSHRQAWIIAKDAEESRYELYRGLFLIATCACFGCISLYRDDIKNMLTLLVIPLGMFVAGLNLRGIQNLHKATLAFKNAINDAT